MNPNESSGQNETERSSRLANRGDLKINGSDPSIKVGGSLSLS